MWMCYEAYVDLSLQATYAVCRDSSSAAHISPRIWSFLLKSVSSDSLICCRDYTERATVSPWSDLELGYCMKTLTWSVSQICESLWKKKHLLSEQMWIFICIQREAEQWHLEKCLPFGHGIRVFGGAVCVAGAVILSHLRWNLNLHLNLTLPNHTCLNCCQERKHGQVVVYTCREWKWQNEKIRDRL